MSLKNTFKNLFELVKCGILTNNSIALYLYYRLNQGLPTPMKSVRSYLQLSTTAIALHNKILRMLDLIVLESEGVGKPNIPIEVNSLSDDALNCIVTNESLLLQIAKLRDKRYHRFAPGSYCIKNNKGKKGEVSLLDTSRWPDQLKLVVKLLPEEHRNFHVTHSYSNRLIDLSESIDLGDYTRWFVKKKLGKTVNGFSLGIFLFSGIITEYKKVCNRRMKLKKRKSVKGRKFSDSKIAEEFG